MGDRNKIIVRDFTYNCGIKLLLIVFITSTQSVMDNIYNLICDLLC